MANTVREFIINGMKEERVTNKNRATCCRCGEKFASGTMIGTVVNTRSNGKYIYTCQSCFPNTYYHGNEIVEIGKPNNDLLKIGVELETSYIHDNARQWFYQKSWESTNDSSLRDNEYRGRTCEMVSALHNGFKAMTKQLPVIGKYMEEGLIEMNESCGTHLHISVQGMVSPQTHTNIMERLRNNRQNIFGKVEKLMRNNPQKTKEFFGRNFTNYANTFAQEEKYSRYAWVNLTRSTDIEFRLNKFRNAEQYHKLAMFEIDVVKTIVYNINDPQMSFEELSQILADKLEKAWG